MAPVIHLSLYQCPLPCFLINGRWDVNKPDGGRGFKDACCLAWPAFALLPS